MCQCPRNPFVTTANSSASAPEQSRTCVAICYQHRALGRSLSGHHLPHQTLGNTDPAIGTGSVSSHFHTSLGTHLDRKVGNAVQEGDGKSSHLVLTRTEFQWL